MHGRPVKKADSPLVDRCAHSGAADQRGLIRPENVTGPEYVARNRPECTAARPKRVPSPLPPRLLLNESEPTQRPGRWPQGEAPQHLTRGVSANGARRHHRFERGQESTAHPVSAECASRRTLPSPALPCPSPHGPTPCRAAQRCRPARIARTRARAAEHRQKRRGRGPFLFSSAQAPKALRPSQSHPASPAAADSALA